MARTFLFEALGAYAETWKKLPSRKAYVSRERCTCELPRSQRDLIAVFLSDDKGGFHKADALLRCSCQSDVHSTFVTHSGSCELQDRLAEASWVRGGSSQRARTLRGRPGYPRMIRVLEQHEREHFETPWDLSLVDPEEEPLTTYEEFLTFALRSPKRLSFPADVASQPFEIGETEYDLPRSRVQLADFARAITSLEVVEETEKDYWAIARDERADVELRCQSLQALMSSEEENAAQFIVSELCRPDLSRPWRDCLLLFTENVQSSDEMLRAMLRNRLFEIASVLRESSETGMKPIVFSAIRSYASLLGQSDADSLLPFLEPPNLIETRLVTLQCLVHLFESHPPERASAFPSLSNRVHELAEKFLDRDWLVAGEKAAIGQNAAHALAVLGDERLGNCVKKIKSLELPWLIRQVASKLEGTLEAWRAGVDPSSPAFGLIQEQLRALSM